MRIRRREFLASAGASLVAFGLPTVLRLPRREKLRLGVVGVGGRGAANLHDVSQEHIAALCDVDARHLEGAVARHPDAQRFRDWREMLSNAKLDGVVISTPDHTHAAAALFALKRRIPVYLEKPLTHTVAECRALMHAASNAGVATQMGIQIHAGDNYQRVAHLLQSGFLGRVSRVTAWVGTDWSATGTPPTAPVPKELDYELWLGPEVSVPFAQPYHPAAWRRYWRFGGGGLADMACHYLDLAWWGLGLGAPATVTAQGPQPDAAGAPSWMRCTWEIPHGDHSVTVLWHGGSDRPTQRLLALGCNDFGNGILFEGEQGMIVADYDHWRLLQPGDPARPVPHFEAPRIGHHDSWLRAIRDGGRASCDFAYSGRLTESVLLGNIAFRTQQTVHWDAQRGVCSTPEANALLLRPQRPGWIETP